MKKSFLFAATLLLALGTTAAQDTLTMNGPKDGYKCPVWYNTPGRMSWNANRIPQSMACEIYNKGGLTVYGIAAIILSPHEQKAMSIIPDEPMPNVIDTSAVRMEGYMRIYDYVGGTLVQRPEELLVNKLLTPVDYYLRFDFDTLFNLFIDLSQPAGDFVFPVYERFFDSALVMNDTFFVGLTDPQYVDYVDSLPSHHYSVNCPMFTDFSHLDFDKPAIATQFSATGSWHIITPTSAVYYIFPILTPGENLPDNPIDTTSIDTTVVNPIDTTGIDTTGVGIADVQLVGRYVSLQPNPAAERVLVTSSFGLQRVEIYNAAGARVRDEQASGYTTTLTVGDLPEGAYLLRIHTPLGATTKKLVVKRQ